MEPLIVALLIVAAVGGYLVYRRVARPAAPPAEDAWELPPAPGAPGPGAGAPPAREVFDRDALLNRRRDFDPSAWDAAGASAEGEPGRPAPPPLPSAGAAPAWDTADEPDAEEPGDLPRFFDRDYLERRARERGERS